MGLLKKSFGHRTAHNDGEGADKEIAGEQLRSHANKTSDGIAPSGNRHDNSLSNSNHQSTNIDMTVSHPHSANTQQPTVRHNKASHSPPRLHEHDQAREDATQTEQDRTAELNRDNEPVNTGHAVRTQRYKSASIPSGAMLTKLQKISIFETIKDDLDSLHEIIKITKSVRIGGNLPVIEEGSIGNEMFIVYSGAVEIKKLTRAGDTYTVVKLSQAQNIFFGELALIDNDRRSATVTTLVDSTFLVINSHDFHELGKKSPHIVLPIVQSIAKILSKRLRKTTADMLTIFDALVQEISET